MSALVADYVIVGAGSAGCVLANRLSSDPDNRVVLIEAGGSNRSLKTRMPSAFYMPIGDPTYDWDFVCEPSARLNNRVISCPRGKGLGGSSAINGMVYVRGNAQDYDNWEQLGARGWGYEQVLPYFKRAQTFVGAVDDGGTRGTEGPLRVTNGPLTNPLYGAFLQAAQEAGFDRREDLNDGDQEGFGPLPMTVASGVRASSAQAYLEPVRGRSNLTVLTGRHVARVEFGAAREAVGVQLTDGQSIGAQCEVVLCAGAIQSPQLLQLSGVGPADLLQSLGIAQVADRAEVGRNLMDHLEVYVQQACSQPVSLLQHLGVLGRVKVGLRWLANRSGPGASNQFEAGGFVRSHPQAAYPDIQFHFLPMAMTYDGKVQATQHGYQAHVGPMLSHSRGSVVLRDRDPLSAPIVDFNYMAHEDDWRGFRAAIRCARDIFAQSAFDPYRGEELKPGAHIVSDDELDEFVRAHAESAYHPCGTCRMGSDEQAVVDPSGRVNGVSRLRVIDASIFPRLINCNINAPTIMVAEKLADAVMAARES